MKILSKSEAGQDLDRDAALKVYFDTISANLKKKVRLLPYYKLCLYRSYIRNSF